MTRPIAKVGGIAFAIATFVAVLIWAPKDQLILSSLLGGAVIVLFGIWDDRIGLNPRMKFIGQVSGCRNGDRLSQCSSHDPAVRG